MIEKINFNGVPAVQFTAGGYEAIMVPSVGANVVKLKHLATGIEILRTPEADEMDNFKERPQIYGLPLLFPPNRIADGTYTFEGRKYQYPITIPAQNNYHHGIIKGEPFDVSRTVDGDGFAEVEAVYYSNAFNNAIANAGERPWRVRAMRNERYRISSHATMSVFSYDIHEGEKREVFYDCDIRDEAFKVVRAYGGEVLHPTLCLRCYAVRPENPYPEANISTVEYDAASMGLEEGVVSERRFAHGTRDIVLHAPLENVPFPGEPQRDQWVQEEDCEYLPQSYITRGLEATVCPYLDFRSVYRFN